MKLRLLFLIICGLISFNKLKAQTPEKYSVDSLKKVVFQFLDDGLSKTSNYIIKYTYHQKNDKESVFSYPGELSGKIFENHEGIIFPFKTGNYVFQFQELPEGPGYEYSPTQYKSGEQVARVLYIGNWCFHVFIVWHNRKEHHQIYEEVIKKSEAFCRSLILLRIETFNTAYHEFERNYNEKKNANPMTANNTISEEQRKLIVQANYFNDKKDYKKALELYKQAIQFNESAYPQAYFNLALIAAEMRDYSYAILNMKKYLLLMPEAEDTRKAQDKIYEWEAELNLYISRYLKQ